MRPNAGDLYDTHAYHRAIKHGCAAVRREQKKAGLPVNHEDWSPNRLRKAAAQFAADQLSLDDVRALLGHEDKELTRRHYA